MVFKFGSQVPKTLSWVELDRIIKELGAVYLGKTGSHRKYIRDTEQKSYPIVFPEYKECGPDIVKSVIRLSGVGKKEFWAVYFGAKNITKKEIEVPK